MINDTAVDSKVEGIDVLAIRPEHLCPWRFSQLEPSQQVASDIASRLSVSAAPRRPGGPITGKGAPCEHSCHAEGGMRLGFIHVLGAPHGNKRRLGKSTLDQRHRIS